MKPLLARHPDARRAPAPLLEPILLPYVAIMFGSVVAAAVATYNALMLRRPALIARSLLLGVMGWLGFLMMPALLRPAGITNLSVAVILGRLVHFAIGGVMFWIFRPHAGGHEFLGGKNVPLLPSYLVAFLIAWNLPARVTLMLLGVPFVR